MDNGKEHGNYYLGFGGLQGLRFRVRGFEIAVLGLDVTNVSWNERCGFETGDHTMGAHRLRLSVAVPLRP